MNGNGQDAPPQETASIWGDMFGMSSLFKMISSPELMAHTHQMLAAVIEGANANRRIEAKLDRLLRALGHEIADINDRFPAQFRPPGLAPLLERNGALGTGSRAAASGPSDDGSALTADHAATDGDHSRNGVEDDAVAGPEPR
jgi:hypothetical protein